MRHSPDIADFAADVAFDKSAPSPFGRVGPLFNLALFTFLALKGLIVFLATSPRAQTASPAGLVLSSLADFLLVATMVLISAVFLRAFWRRFVSSVWPLRPITYNEAIAILLMASLLFSTIGPVALVISEKIV